MRPRPIVFREAPRFLPLRQRELTLAVRPIRRVTFLFGPVLSLLALWVLVHHAGREVLDPAKRVGLFVAPFALLAVFEIPVWLSRVPRLGRFFLHAWHVLPGGLTMQGGLGATGVPWSAVRSLRVEESAEEVTLHLDFFIRGRELRRSLTCRRAEVRADEWAFFTGLLRERTPR